MHRRLIILDPAHFHASLVQKEMYPDLDPRVSVYAPLGSELIDYLKRIALFNSRPSNPTRWELDIHCGSDPLSEMMRDQPGDIVVLAGRNRTKINRILGSISAGANVLADKPWIISSAAMPKLEQALAHAQNQGLIAYDIMTERYEVTSQLQRELVNSPELFGKFEPGTFENPGVRARSVHNIMKTVSGLPLQRPAWFFDIAEAGEGLADVGTHVIDLVQWTAFAEQAIDYRQDIELLRGRRWPLKLTAAQFQAVTGESRFPLSLDQYVHDGELHYYCNNSVDYALRGLHVSLEITWDWQAPEGAGDVYEAVFRGTKARVEIRQGEAEKQIPELYVIPVKAEARESVYTALRDKVRSLHSRWPGLSIFQSPQETRIVIPDQFRVGHEAHFGQVSTRFFEYLRSPDTIPAWETPNMLAKYYVSTKGVELAHSGE
jgi:predicted dehydrogenase